MPTILVIDDDPAIRQMVQLVLENRGYGVTVAKHGRDGMAVIAAQPIDLVIVDIFMPDMDGFETIMALRAKRPGLPVIAMSGSLTSPTSPSQPNFLTMAAKLGAVTTLPKPFRPRDLLQAVSGALPA